MTREAKKSLNCVCPAGRERSYGGMPKAGRCPKYTFFEIRKEKKEKKCAGHVVVTVTSRD